MPSLQDKAWVWGYVIDGPIPGKVPWAPNNTSGCSLETAADYVQAPNVVFMNSNHSLDTLTDAFFKPLSRCKQIICGLRHGAYAETAGKVSRLSKTIPNITGGL